MRTLKDELRSLGAELECALEDSLVPLYLVSSDGRFRWTNRCMTELLGQLVGRRFLVVVAAEQAQMARRQFARKLIGEATATDFDLTLIDRDQHRVPVRIQSVPLRSQDAVVGVFGAAIPCDEAEGPKAGLRGGAHHLTARQLEVLQLLAEGLGTAAIGARLGVSDDTVRNHIRAMLRELGVHSRLEAVVEAYRLGILRHSSE
jgi:PAS domain S-box-containing protein